MQYQEEISLQSFCLFLSHEEPVSPYGRMVVVVPPERHPVISGIRQSAYYPGDARADVNPI